MPNWQLGAGTGHVIPHPPQLFGSVWASTQVPSPSTRQAVIPVAQGTHNAPALLVPNGQITTASAKVPLTPPLPVPALPPLVTPAPPTSEPATARLPLGALAPLAEPVLPPLVARPPQLATSTATKKADRKAPIALHKSTGHAAFARSNAPRIHARTCAIVSHNRIEPPRRYAAARCPSSMRAIWHALKVEHLREIMPSFVRRALPGVLRERRHRSDGPLCRELRRAVSFDAHDPTLRTAPFAPIGRFNRHSP